MSPLFETLFVLARTSFILSNPATYNTSYAYLERASRVVAQSREKPSSIPVPALANYVRCVSGAFHHIAGMLHQSGRYSHCVRFLVEGCALGGRALELYRTIPDEDVDKGKTDAWEQLDEQLHRRWELLAVCHAKCGDRKVGYTILNLYLHRSCASRIVGRIRILRGVHQGVPVRLQLVRPSRTHQIPIDALRLSRAQAARHDRGPSDVHRDMRTLHGTRRRLRTWLVPQKRP